MTFELYNEPVTFQRITDVISLTDKKQGALVYLENIVISRPTTDKRIEHVRNSFLLLPKAGTLSNLKNCRVFTGEVKYLGKLIGRSRFKLSEKSDAFATERQSHIATPVVSLPCREEYLSVCSYLCYKQVVCGLMHNHAKGAKRLGTGHERLIRQKRITTLCLCVSGSSTDYTPPEAFYEGGTIHNQYAP